MNLSLIHFYSLFLFISYNYNLCSCRRDAFVAGVRWSENRGYRDRIKNTYFISKSQNNLFIHALHKNGLIDLLISLWSEQYFEKYSKWNVIQYNIDTST